MTQLRRLFLALVVLLTGALVAPSVAHADPLVTQTYRSAGSYRFTLTADAGNALYTAGPTDGTNPVTSGGCRIVSHRNALGRVIIDGVRCLTPGTVGWNSKISPACDTLFSIRADGVTIWSTLLNSPCPPPPPPPVSVTYVTNLDADPDLDQVVFYNPATVVQNKGVAFTVPAADSTVTVDPASALDYWNVVLVHGGTATNPFIYYQGQLGVIVQPGQTVTATL